LGRRVLETAAPEEKMMTEPRKPNQRPMAATAQGRFDQMMAGCPVHSLRAKLKEAGLRPTRQRMALGLLLFAKGDRHLTAERLYEEAQELRVPVSLATVYNGLHVFTEAGLLREVAVDGTKVYYDTNVSDHHHFLLEDSNMLIDIPAVAIDRTVVPELPEGMEIAAIDVVVRLRRKQDA
jgi:Fur family iron response transcriptional regulator